MVLGNWRRPTCLLVGRVLAGKGRLRFLSSATLGTRRKIRPSIKHQTPARPSKRDRHRPPATAIGKRRCLPAVPTHAPTYLNSLSTALERAYVLRSTGVREMLDVALPRTYVRYRTLFALCLPACSSTYSTTSNQ